MDYYNSLYYYVVLILFISMIISRIFLSRTSAGAGLLLPPGPPGLPIIGNLHQLNLSPHRVFHRMAATYGPIMHLKLGAIPTIVISSPNLAKQFLQTHDHLISSHYVPDTVLVHNHQDMFVLFLPVCPKWRNMRKALTTEIFSHARLGETQAIRTNKVHQLVEYVSENAGRAVDVGFVAFITMINSLSNTLISMDLADYDSKSSMEFRLLVMRSMELVAKPNLSDFFPALRFFDLQGLRRESGRNLNRLLAIIESFIDQRAGVVISEDRRDVLDTLLRKQHEYELSTKDISHLFAELFIAGTDTSSTTVEWAMTELLRNPDKLKKAQAEVRSVVGNEKLVQASDIPKLKYLQAVMKETFRLHPAGALLVPRKAVAQVKIDGFTVPKGSQILINIWSMGRDSKIWPDAELFEPERFLDSEIDFKGRHFELIPFGAGRRICPGLNMANLLVQMVLGSLIHAFDWVPENGIKGEEDIDISDKFELTLRKLKPLRAIPTKHFHC